MVKVKVIILMILLDLFVLILIHLIHSIARNVARQGLTPPEAGDSKYCLSVGVFGAGPREINCYSTDTD